MRILFDAHLSENNISGIGRYINELIKALVLIDKKNEYLILILDDLTAAHPLIRLEAPNLTKISVNFRGLSLRQHWVTRGLVRHYRPDVYHHPHFDLPIGISSPSIVTIHDLKYLHHPEYFPKLSRLKSQYMKCMFQSALRRASKVIAVSESTKKDIGEMFSINSQDVIVIHHGIHSITKNHHHLSQDFFDNHGIKKPFILFVGVRRPHKNLTGLIDAFNRVLKTAGDELQLVIVGNSYKDYDMPERVIAERGLDQHVILMDYIEDDSLETLYRNTEMLVLPSLYEGFGFPILEAMKFDVPVIGANTTSIPEVLGNAGLLVDPLNPEEIAEKIISLLTSHQLRERLIQLGKKRVKEFTWEKAALNTLKVYRQVY
jgi:glycosyltransferase involved in cell wall biosynthesis